MTTTTQNNRRSERFYTPDGSPKHIRCFEYKGKDAPADRFTVIYTRADRAGCRPGYAYYISMSENPYHALGIGQHGECELRHFKPTHGTRISFHDLPPDCQRVVERDYDEMWNIN